MEMVFEALTGLGLSAVSLIGLALFYGAGVWFGRLTRNISLLKLLLAAIVTYYGFTLLANAPGAFIIAFIIGLATNHISFTMEAIYWAEDISDFLYALRHPEAFEDIRDTEQASTSEYAHQGRWGNDGSKRAGANSEKRRSNDGANKARPDTGGSAEAFRKVGKAYEWMLRTI